MVSEQQGDGQGEQGGQVMPPVAAGETQQPADADNAGTGAGQQEAGAAPGGSPAPAAPAAQASPSEGVEPPKSQIKVPGKGAATAAKVPPKKRRAASPAAKGGGIKVPSRPSPRPRRAKPPPPPAAAPKPPRAAAPPPPSSAEPAVALQVDPPGPGRRLLRQTRPFVNRVLFPFIYRLSSVVAGSAQRSAVRRCRAKISADHFWYVDLPATGSEAIRHALGEHFGPVPKKAYVRGGLHGLAEPSWPITWTAPQECLFGGRSLRAPFPAHVGAVRALELVGADLWPGLYTFSMVRDPWDRLLALYRAAREAGRRLPTFRDFALALPALRRALDDTALLSGSVGLELMQQSQLLSGAELSHIARYESWEQELKLIGGKLQCPDLASLPRPSEPVREDEGDRPYAAFYDDDTRAAVAEFYAEDISTYGYEFVAKGGS